MTKTLDTKLAEIRRDHTSRAFIIADSKDAEIGCGLGLIELHPGWGRGNLLGV